jgi:hypothetical protein
LGLGGSLRFGGGPAYGGGGLTAFSQFALDHWLLDVAARVDLADALLNQPPPSDFRMQSSAVGVAVGRRLEFDGTRVDGLLGSNVVLESQDADQSNREIHGAAADFRLAVALRVSAPRASSVRAYVTADFEASPARIRTQRHIDRSLPSLPWWSSGVAIGVLWGAR